MLKSVSTFRIQTLQSLSVSFSRNLTEQNSDEKKRRRLLLEIDSCRHEGLPVPAVESITENQWQYIESLNSLGARRKYYKYLARFLFRKAQRKIPKEPRNKQETSPESSDGHISYGLRHNSFFLRVYGDAIDKWRNQRLFRAMQFGPQLVVDCAFDDQMNMQEAHSTAEHIQLAFAANRNHPDPFDLHFCSLDPHKATFRRLEKLMPNIHESRFPINLHTESLLEHFPREQLVYVTPFCRSTMTHYDPESIYVVGARVDRSNSGPQCLARAKRLGIRVARPPFERFLQFSGSKSLPLNQLVGILLDIRSTGDWTEAFRHVPKRKLRNFFYDSSEKHRFLKFEMEVERSLTKPSSKRHKPGVASLSQVLPSQFERN